MTELPLVLLLVALLGACGEGEVFTSSHHLAKMFLVERGVVEALETYLAAAETRLGRIRRYLQEYEAVRTDARWTQADKIPSLSSSSVHDTNNSNSSNNCTYLNNTNSISCANNRSNQCTDDKSKNCSYNNSNNCSNNNKNISNNSTNNCNKDRGDRQRDGAEALASNPLHVFHLVKRLSVYWRHIDAQVIRHEWDEVLRALRGGEDSPASLPDEGDLQGAAQALVRLQLVYGLNTSEVAEGRVQGLGSSAGLTSQDCLYIGKHAYNLGLPQQAVAWFEEAGRLAAREGGGAVSLDVVAGFLNTALETLRNSETEAVVQEESSYLQNAQSENDMPLDENNEVPGGTEHIANINFNEELPKDFQYYGPDQDEENFFSLCRGERVLPPKAEAHLYCYVGSPTGPRVPLPPQLILMPPKVEVQHPGPSRLLTIHEVLTDREIEELKRLADPILSRAMVQGLEGRGNTVSSTRTSMVAWLDDATHPLVGRLNRRVGLLTGLSTDVVGRHAEVLQVANYGTGGHYNPHHDYLLVDKSPHQLGNIDPRELEMGDRVATFMFYLSDVQSGGATAFPRLGVAVPPVRGTAAFWYNLRSSGARDRHTLHGACPVLLGSKWVSNKWIRERGQFLSRPCALVP